MMKTKRSSKSLQLSLLMALAIAPISSLHANFSEPGIILYGKVTNEDGGKVALITSGTLNLQLVPSSGAPLAFAISLEKVGEEYSYRVVVPVERIVDGFTLSAGTIATGDGSQTLSASELMVDGEPAIAEFEDGADSIDFSEQDRGAIRRLDIRFSMPFQDSDFDGIPDFWEHLYAHLGLDPSNPTDRDLDPDGNGLSFLEEYTAASGPDGLDYAAWVAAMGLVGDAALVNADEDGDGNSNGVEFALDLNPFVADAGKANQRMTLSLVDNGDRKNLELLVRKPAIPRSKLLYGAEVSTDLERWRSDLGVHVEVVEESAELQRVRDLTEDLARKFMQLKITLEP